MSKIGNKPINIEESVEVEISNALVNVKGPEGELTVNIPKEITATRVDKDILFQRLSEAKKVRSLHGLIRSLVANAVLGVTKPWEKTLEVVGTGYRVKLKGKNLVFEVGYSHPVEFHEVQGLTYIVDGNKVTISGIDKQLVGEVAHKVKSIRKPDPYKGKGIRYSGELIRLKPGKKAKTA
ncbi:50S ribosomal protein L6 [Candidatus Roizmanbacteria bacterium RIFCSPLOWO2_01_FULL_42_14]|uniref:Large ribosomal subunit protein uL6 n=4 Tax=Candidatus Roizmaniibacteriota TaxID=1752723 RepID=A0A1F7JUZ7_9BACT|nr:MAG: 50S ribosomal protein L6 [Candidatus Roizmanbacteria bacterium RIFCSPHIGHO2_02_FULL_43_11]OGK38608.1 MAG: 50S ribosomal protein L6 [Candidatus Roizmanbacteria bacterium RIFCSPHIGHO2_12_FULL_42_10]OGK52202.1 MAG: 50S ribosomal protein L6 [Candidatus Roizmanbacteria bacterium RIFCSPLOWO2_01_FULL_42_14]OGK59435.1 MAG: 50S ribosomal protein L6 [Candidatus Roizmanbacteria bacterium RIFCSPLOWO2_02_FULL_43_10]